MGEVVNEILNRLFDKPVTRFEFEALSSLLNIELEDPLVGIKLFQFSISKSPLNVKSFIVEKDLLHHIGIDVFQSLEQNYCIQFKSNELFSDKGKRTAALNANATAALTMLWLIKDNSVFSVKMYSRRISPSQFGADQRTEMFSNSKGKYEVVKFLIKEIDFLKENLNIISKLFITNTIGLQKTNQIPNSYHHINRSSISEISYNKKITRPQRSFMFIDIARRASILPIKISNYIIAMECLFSRDERDTSHLTPQRAAFYVGGIEDEIIKTYDIFRTGYGLRSDFLHGNHLKDDVSDYSFQAQLSSQIDNLLRTIFRNIVTQHYDIFSESDQKLFLFLEGTKWFSIERDPKKR